MSRFSFARPSLELSFIACSIAQADFVIPIAKVREIVQPLRFTQVPEAPDFVLGALDHRGEVVPLIDLGMAMSGKPTEDPRRKWVLVQCGERILGVVVQSVFEVFRVPESELRRAPDLAFGKGFSTKDVVRFRDRIAFVLDLDVVQDLLTKGLPQDDLPKEFSGSSPRATDHGRGN